MYVIRESYHRICGCEKKKESRVKCAGDEHSCDYFIVIIAIIIIIIIFIIIIFIITRIAVIIYF